MKDVNNFLIVDDDAIVRGALGYMVTKSFPSARITSCTGLEDGMKALDSCQWDVILIDLCLGKSSGLVLIYECTNRQISAPILVMSSRQDEEAALPAFKAGAKGYICKDQAEVCLIEALQRLMNGQKYISESLASRLLGDVVENKDTTLSPQESTVLIHIGSGRSVKECAGLMGLSEKTVRTYRGRLLEKLNINSDAAIVRYAIENRLIA